MDAFRSWAQPMLEGAGYDVSDDDLALMELVWAATSARDPLADLDPDRFPFEPIDPSRAP